jgi:hypothetical protein
MVKLVSLALMVIMAAPAAAQTAPPGRSSPTASSSKARDPNRIVCEREEQLGSRLGGAKVCKTAAEWDEERRANREAVDNWQRQATSPGAPSGG